jgi:error-prone DNA polymerase
VLFQEQVLKVARDLAGFTPGQGELLRRALGRKNAEDAIQTFHDDFVGGATGLGVAEEVAQAVFEALRAFGGYSFPKSHAAAFAVLVYRSAWLKRYHAPAFYCALLNHQPMGFWSPAVIVNDAKRHGVPVLPVDIHHSQTRCTVEGEGIRLGFEQVKGLGAGHGEAITTARERCGFRDLGDFCRRTQLPRRLVEHLILAGAMDGWGHTRRSLVWQLGRLEYRAGTLDLDLPPDEVNFPAVSPLAALGVEYELLGVATGRHVMELYRPQLDERGILSSADLAGCADGQRVRVAGLVVVHQSPPTAKGTHFVTLEDEGGFLNIVLRPEVYAKYRSVVRECPLLLVEGVVQTRDGVVNVVASRVVGM